MTATLAAMYPMSNLPPEFPRFCVITPARNEADNIARTIECMARQVVRPLRWVVVNDGSTDETASIIAAAAEALPWMRTVNRPDRGYRLPGGGVVDTVYAGLATLADVPWDFLVKFDADLSFAPDYFQRCFEKFRADPKLGIGGGLICDHANGTFSAESPGDPAFHVRGATKIYRRECWDAIGGLVRAAGWDSIDELKANMLGWHTHTFTDIPLGHHRETGRADGTWKNYVKFGLANYITGYHPLFMSAKCLKRAVEKPYGIGAVGLWWGYWQGYVKRIPRVNDAELIQYVRRQQLRKLAFKSSIW